MPASEKVGLRNSKKPKLRPQLRHGAYPSSQASYVIRSCRRFLTSLSKVSNMDQAGQNSIIQEEKKSLVQAVIQDLQKSDAFVMRCYTIGVEEGLEILDEVMMTLQAEMFVEGQPPLVSCQEDFFHSHLDTIKTRFIEYLKKMCSPPSSPGPTSSRPNPNPPMTAPAVIGHPPRFSLSLTPAPLQRMFSESDLGSSSLEDMKNEVEELRTEFPIIEEEIIESIVRQNFEAQLSKEDRLSRARSFLSAISPRDPGSVNIGGNAGQAHSTTAYSIQSPIDAQPPSLSLPETHSEISMSSLWASTPHAGLSPHPDRLSRPTSGVFETCEVENDFQLIRNQEEGVQRLENEITSMQMAIENLRSQNEREVEEIRHIVEQSNDPLLLEYYKLTQHEQQIRRDIEKLQNALGKRSHKDGSEC